jgi:predicted RND superfamily exporter protein
MWNRIASLILRNKITFIVILGALTIFMGYRASRIQLSYEFAKVLPVTDPAFKEYEEFTHLFGEDANVMVIGIQDSNFFTKDKFNDWFKLSNQIQNIQGIQNVLGITQIYKLQKDDSLSKFKLVKVVRKEVANEFELDSVKKEIYNLPFYNQLLYNKETGAHLLAITFKKKDLDSKRRIAIVEEIKKYGDQFEAKYKIDLKYSGMPYIRTAVMKKVSGEMTLFLILAII